MFTEVVSLPSARMVGTTCPAARFASRLLDISKLPCVTVTSTGVWLAVSILKSPPVGTK